MRKEREEGRKGEKGGERKRVKEEREEGREERWFANFSASSSRIFSVLAHGRLNRTFIVEI